MTYFDKTTHYHTTNTATSTQASSPSLSDSSPSLTQSMSNSSNSHSPPLPTTPPPPRQSRTNSRYPDNLGRVPLHRRGTSQTYERLEDLLREAGYKETRIFTPEGEHEDVTYHEQDPESPSARRTKGGVGAVVEFLTGLLPSSTTTSVKTVASVATTTTRPESTENMTIVDSPKSPFDRPSTPSVSSQTQKPAYASGHSTPRTMMSSTEDIQAFRRSNSPIIGTPVPRSPNLSRPQSPYLSRQQHLFPQQHGPPQNALRGHPPLSRQSSLRVVSELPQEPMHPVMPIAHPHPSRATAYLRRMASRQDVPERPSSTPVRMPPRISLNDSDTDIGGYRGNGEGEEDHRAPPLPRTWLETVARAVLLGGNTTYIGGPSQQKSDKTGPQVPEKGRTQTLRHSRSSLSQVSSRSHPRKSRPSCLHGLRNTLSDQTNMSQSKLSVRSTNSSGVSPETLAPPELFLRIERGRATTSESQVFPTRVYCRSTPGSRAASVVRDGGKEKTLLKVQSGKKKSGRKAERDRVPSLAKTKAEGDMWARPRKRKAGKDDATPRVLDDGGQTPRYPRHRHRASIRLGDGLVCGYGSEAAVGYKRYGYEHEYEDSEEEEASDEYDEDDDDDEDGELDLARMLVPPKRQHSIISLRKHLAVTVAGSAVAAGRARGSYAPVAASRLGEGVGVGEFESEIEGGGGASAALSRVVGVGMDASSTTIPAMRILGAYASGSGSGPVAAKRRLQ